MKINILVIWWSRLPFFLLSQSPKGQKFTKENVRINASLCCCHSIDDGIGSWPVDQNRVSYCLSPFKQQLKSGRKLSAAMLSPGQTDKRESKFRVGGNNAGWAVLRSRFSLQKREILQSLLHVACRLQPGSVSFHRPRRIIKAEGPLRREDRNISVNEGHCGAANSHP